MQEPGFSDVLPTGKVDWLSRTPGGRGGYSSGQGGLQRTRKCDKSACQALPSPAATLGRLLQRSGIGLADSGKRYVSLRVETRRVLPLVKQWGEQYYGFLLLFRFRIAEVTDMFDREIF